MVARQRSPQAARSVATRRGATAPSAPRQRRKTDQERVAASGTLSRGGFRRRRREPLDPALLDGVTGDQTGSPLVQERALGPAARVREGAARVKGAARRRRDGVRHFAADRLAVAL